MTVLPKVLKARPLQMHPPSTELPDSEGSENDEPGEEDWHIAEDEVSAPAREDARRGRGKKRDRPRGVAGPRGVETSSAANVEVAEQDTRRREPGGKKSRRHGIKDTPLGESGAAAAATTKSGFRPKR